MTLGALHTERTVLELPRPEEAQDVLDYFERNRGHLERWEPARPEHFYTQTFWRDRLAANLMEARDARAVRLFIRERGRGDSLGRYIGTCNFTNVVLGAFRACHLGYAVDGTLEGRGLMREALTCALPKVADVLGLHRVMANYQPTNARSGALLKRLGFVVEGYARDYLFIDGAWRDHVLASWIALE